LQVGPFSVGAETPDKEEIRQPAGAVRGFREGTAAITAHSDRPVRDDLGDRVQDRPYGPFGHGYTAEPTLMPSKSNALSRMTFRMSASLKPTNSLVNDTGSSKPSPCGQSDPNKILSTPMTEANSGKSSS